MNLKTADDVLHTVYRKMGATGQAHLNKGYAMYLVTYSVDRYARWPSKWSKRP